MRLFGLLVCALLLTAGGGEQYPGQYPGPHTEEQQAVIDDRSQWTASQHIWFEVHRLMDHLAQVIALAIAGGASALWMRRHARNKPDANA